jgi:hypothetical protein
MKNTYVHSAKVSNYCHKTDHISGPTAGEPIHEGQFLVANTIINNLVDERGWKVVFWTSMVEIVKVCADANSALVFVNVDWVETHEVYIMGHMNLAACKFSISSLIVVALGG